MITGEQRKRYYASQENVINQVSQRHTTMIHERVERGEGRRGKRKLENNFCQQVFQFGDH